MLGMTSPMYNPSNLQRVMTCQKVSHVLKGHLGVSPHPPLSHTASVQNIMSVYLDNIWIIMELD